VFISSSHFHLCLSDLHSKILVEGAAGVASWAEPSSAPCQTRAAPDAPKGPPLLPQLSCEWHWVCTLGREDLRERKSAEQQQLGERSEKHEITALQAPRSAQEELQAHSSSSLQPRRGPQRNRPSSCSPRAPHRADLPMQPQRSPQGSGGWGLKGTQPTHNPTRAARARAAARGKQQGWWKLCLSDAPEGWAPWADSYWSSS